MIYWRMIELNYNELSIFGVKKVCKTKIKALIIKQKE
jgi:hypothetical protein